MRCLFVMFVAAAWFLFLLTSKWPQNKNFYDNTRFIDYSYSKRLWGFPVHSRWIRIVFTSKWALSIHSFWNERLQRTSVLELLSLIMLTERNYKLSKKKTKTKKMNFDHIFLFIPRNWMLGLFRSSTLTCWGHGNITSLNLPLRCFKGPDHRDYARRIFICPVRPSVYANPARKRGLNTPSRCFRGR